MRVIFNLIIKSILLVVIGIFIYEIPFLYHELSYVIKPFGSYQISDRDNNLLDTGSARIITPQSTHFGLVVPKIGINEIVHQDNIKHDTGTYHLSSSSNPGSRNEVIIQTFFSKNEMITRKNAIFPLLHRLIPGDEIFMYYNDKKYTYQVEELKTISTTTYLKGVDKKYTSSLRIDVNWPPGLYFQKLMVYATLVD